jgi:tetratricopeptide (TPR) repeat protein
MDTDATDIIKAKILEAEMALSPVRAMLDADATDLKPGIRSQAEAFVANAPSLYGHEHDSERIFMTLDIAVSAIESDPTFGGGYALAAACIYRLGSREVDSYDTRALIAAIPWAYRATTVDPENQDGWETYIQIHCHKGDFGTAEKALGRVFRRFGDNDLYARCAFLYFRLKGDVGQAINWGALAWQTEWDTRRLVHTLLSLGALYCGEKKWGKALDVYRMIIERDRENARAFQKASQCAHEMGDLQLAIEFSEGALKISDQYEFVAWRAALRKAAGAAINKRARISSGIVVPPPPVVTKTVPAPRAIPKKTVPAPPPAKGLKRKP